MTVRIRQASQFVSLFLLSVPLLTTDLGATQLDVQSTARRRAVSGPAVTPDSATLIDKALASGKLDEETALTYRAYAAFADCRLPAEFRGDDSTVETSMILAELAAKFDTLSPAARANLSPFLLEPYAPGGWVAQRETRCAANKTISPSAAAPETLFILGGKVGITFRTDVEGERAIATQIATAVEQTIYPNLTALMGREPLPYFGSVQRWNLNLVTIVNTTPGGKDLGGTGFLQTSAASSVCKSGPAFSQVDPRNPSHLSTVAHELMHAIQFSYELSAACVIPEYRWLADATATWAQHYIYPNPPSPPVGDAEHKQAVHFLSRTESPLDCRGASCPNHEYGAYLLPFYIHRRYNDPQFVRRIWEAAKNNLSLDSVDVALTPHGGFKEQWPEFAKYNWNREPYDDYETWDRLSGSPNRAKADEVEVVLSSPDGELKLDSSPLEIEYLSARYYHFTFKDQNVRSVAFWNGLTFKLSLEDIQSIGVQYNPKPATPEQKKGAHVRALIKVENTVWQETDLTEKPYITFCRDKRAERIEELVLIISNSDKDRQHKLKAPDLEPRLSVSNMGCWQWKGTGNFTTSTLDGSLSMSISTTNATWKRPDGEEQSPPFVFYKAQGTLNWTVSGKCSGSGTLLPILSELSFLFTYNFTPSQGSLHRTYAGLAADSRPVSVACELGFPGPPGLEQWFSSPPQPIVPGIPGARLVRVSADGTLMEGSYKAPFGNNEWKWKFEAQREP